MSEATTLAISYAVWSANPHAVHKRPPYRVTSFDTNDQFWVVGSTGVSVFGCSTYSQGMATRQASELNKAAESLLG